MITANQVFEAAMALSDNLKNGLADNSSTTAYKSRCVPLINMIGQELYPLSDSKVTTAGQRPTFPRILAMTDYVYLDEGLAIAVMPHGLVALLLTDENPTLADYHEQKYMEKQASFKRFPRAAVAITDVYPIADMGGYLE